MNTERFLELVHLTSNKYSEGNEVEYFKKDHAIQVRIFDEDIDIAKKIEETILSHFDKYITASTCEKASKSECECFDCDGDIYFIEFILTNELSPISTGRTLLWDGAFNNDSAKIYYEMDLEEEIFNLYGKLFDIKNEIQELEELKSSYEKILQ